VAAAIPAGWWIQKSEVTPEEEENSTKVHPGKKDHLNKNDNRKGARRNGKSDQQKRTLRRQTRSSINSTISQIFQDFLFNQCINV